MITHISQVKRQSWDLCSPEGEVKVVDLDIWHDEREYYQALDAAVAGNFEWYGACGMVRYVLYKLDLWTFVLRNSVTE